MGDLSFKMVLNLVDKASGKMNRIAGNAQRMGNKISQSVSGMSGRVSTALSKALDPQVLDRSFNRLENRLDRARTRLMDAAAMASIAVLPVLKSGKFEHALAHFGNIAGKTKEELAGIETFLRSTANAVNQTATDLLGGLDYLMGKGLSEADSTGAIEAIGKAATATNAHIDHLSAAAFAGIDNLNVAVEETGTLLDVLAASGKQGGFELRDMAKHFPGITASAKMLGMEGLQSAARLGAALQIAIKGASDPDEAANNFKNFLAKIASPETVTKFKKLGIDIRAELENATAKGLDPMEYMLVRIHDLAEQNPYVIGNLFGDMQVQNFLKPLIANLEEYARIRDESVSAKGVIDTDFANVMDTQVEKMKALGIALDNTTSSANSLGSVVKSVLGDLTALIKAIDEFAKAHPDLTSWIVKGTAALLAFGIAGRLVSYGFFLVASSIVGAAKGAAGFVRLLMRAKGALGRVGRAITSMAKFSWATVMTPLRWATYIPKLAWRSFVTVLRWTSFVPRLAWSGILSALKWTSFVPKLAWATLLSGSKLSWSLLITPLKWFGRFIPVIGWALLAAELGMLAWDLVIKPLNWDEYLNVETLKSLFNDAFGWVEERWNSLTALFSSTSGNATAHAIIPNQSRKGDRLPNPANQNRYERLPSPAEYQSNLISLQAILAAAAHNKTAEQDDKATLVKIPQEVDNSKTVHQTNHFNVRVVGAPAATGQAVTGSLKAAATRALRDTD